MIYSINKPIGWTSFDVVKKIRGITREKKVGHAGTLDPLASGLLIVCTGKFTKRISEIQGQEKTYTGTITLGGTTPSYDLETELDSVKPINNISEKLISKALNICNDRSKPMPPSYVEEAIDGKQTLIGFTKHHNEIVFLLNHGHQK